MVFSLDVGCGSDPKGDVNCDLFVKDVFAHRGVVACEERDVLDVHKIPNFVLCDCRFLPFKDGAFDLVISAQVIEHIPRPFVMFKELSRVSRGRVVLETMHRLGEAFDGHFKPRSAKWFKIHHINKFNIRILNAYGAACGLRVVKNQVLEYFYFPHEYFTLFRFPKEIRVVYEHKAGGFRVD